MQRRVDLSAGILHRLRQGEQDAYDELLHVAFPVLVRFAYHFVHARDVAEDIVQDVLCRVYLKREAFDPGGSVMSYLLAAVRNEALSVLRHEQVASRYQATIEQTTVPVLAIEGSIEQRDLLSRINTLLSTLTERQRTAFILRYERQLTIPEIADILGISAKAAEKLVSRTTHALRERLGPFGPGDGG